MLIFFWMFSWINLLLTKIADLELAAKLDDEAGHEKNNTATDETAEAVKAFLEIESNPWKVCPREFWQEGEIFVFAHSCVNAGLRCCWRARNFPDPEIW